MKKISAFLLAALMIAALLPATGFAADPVAKIGENEYATLAEALAAAQTDDVVDLLGNTFTEVEGFSLNNVSLKNGVITMKQGNRIGIRNTVVLDNVDMTFDMEGTSGYPNSAIYVSNGSCKLSLVNGTDVLIKNPGYIAVYNDGGDTYDLILDNSTLTIQGKGSATCINLADMVMTNGAKLETSNTGIVFNSGSIAVDGTSAVKADGGSSHGITNVVLTVAAGGVVDVDDCAYLGLNLKAGSTIAPGAKVTVDGCGTGGTDGKYKGEPTRFADGVIGVETVQIDKNGPAYAGPVMNWVKVNSADNGVVKSGPLAASAGATITLYPKAAEGYVLDTVEVLDAEGNAVELDGLKFQVPAGGATVNATFKLAE